VPSAAGPRVLAILGATATGKTAIAVDVAQRVGGEIINADSRAFFRGLDIVTAKPTADEQAGIPHHLIDCVPIDGEYDAMSFRRDVEQLVPEIASRGRVPMLVGGGTLYLGAVLRGLFEGPAKDPKLRERLRGESLETLYERLAQVDPLAAETIHARDRQRIVRALEVFEKTGRPISALQAEARPLPFASCIVGLSRERDAHRQAIAKRAERMIVDGLLDEVSALRVQGLRQGMQAYRTIGIPEAVAVLDGDASPEGLAEVLANRTWALARRQVAWFRRDSDVVWVDVTGRSAAEIGERIVERWEERGT